MRFVGQVTGYDYDGRVWQDFENYEGEPFLAAPRNYALMLNVNWMQSIVPPDMLQVIYNALVQPYLTTSSLFGTIAG